MLHPPIGIVVNPASGKDVRRLVAKASVFDNREKQAIVRRAVSGAIAAGANHLAYMDDSHNITRSAIEELEPGVTATAVSCKKTGSALDTENAACSLRELGCPVNLVLGGDGTSRAFVKGWRHAPLLSLSTGTNNVFPQLIEATVAGAVLGLIASGTVDLDAVSKQSKVIDIDIEDEPSDIALIDAVVTSERFVGSRALLDGDALRAVLLTRAEPAAVGMTALGGLLLPVSPDDAGGLLLRMDQDAAICSVSAPIAPGLYQRIDVSEVREVVPGEDINFCGPCVIALDGERERVIKAGQQFAMRVSRTGPMIVNIADTMRLGAQSGAFVKRFEHSGKKRSR